MFANTPVGTTYAITESAAAGYTPECDVVYSSGTANTLNGTLNTKLKIIDTDEAPLRVGENSSSATFTNNYLATADTGFALNSLPFITISVLAVGGLIVYFIIRYRKKI